MGLPQFLPFTLVELNTKIVKIIKSLNPDHAKKFNTYIYKTDNDDQTRAPKVYFIMVLVLTLIKVGGEGMREAEDRVCTHLEPDIQKHASVLRLYKQCLNY